MALTSVTYFRHAIKVIRKNAYTYLPGYQLSTRGNAILLVPLVSSAWFEHALNWASLLCLNGVWPLALRKSHLSRINIIVHKVPLYSLLPNRSLCRSVVVCVTSSPCYCAATASSGVSPHYTLLNTNGC